MERELMSSPTTHPSNTRSAGARRTVRRALAGTAAVAAAAGLMAAAGGPASASGGSGSPKSHEGASRDVIANLFEWNWTSVAKECTTVLGPKGYGGVQVAPPQDSLSKSTGTTDNPAIHPWWEVYQPVDYGLTSRMGNEAQFRAMVASCRKAGVKVYVDAVINHMSGQGHTSYGGVTYRKYHYDGLYGFADFHHAPKDCPTASGTIEDFNNYLQVTECELVGLSDLRTETGRFQDTLAAYLNKLLRYGVSGFRVDAAKHVGHADLAAIEAKLNRTVDGTRPYIALEVPPGGPGKLAPYSFAPQGDLLGFDAAQQLHDAFKSYTADATGSIADLQIFGQNSGLLPSGTSLAFVENHDTERNGSTLSYKDGATNIIATQFLLARGYATPQVYASFAFAANDDSPPADAKGYVTDTDCSDGWVCNDRNTGIANLVGWHNHVAGTPVVNWSTDGVNLIGFSRGSRGWIGINNATTAKTRTFTTGLPAGTYCDIIHGDFASGACSGPTVTVDAGGSAHVTVPAKDAVAFDVTDRVH